MQYKISDIARITSAERHGSLDATINWLLIDSRSLCFPEETLFFAIRTARNDGHRYIEELYRRGVRNFVVEYIPQQFQTSGSLKGPKHGGANIKNVRMFDDIKANVKDWTDEAEISAFLEKIIDKEAFDKSGLIYGIGHF